MQIAGDGEKRDHVKTRREEAGFFTYGVFILPIYLFTVCKTKHFVACSCV